MHSSKINLTGGKEVVVCMCVCVVKAAGSILRSAAGFDVASSCSWRWIFVPGFDNEFMDNSLQQEYFRRKVTPTKTKFLWKSLGRQNNSDVNKP